MDDGLTPRLDTPDALAAYLAVQDAPFRAWAAVSLATAASARHRSEGKRRTVEIADWMPEPNEIQHADLAAYALLERSGYLSREQRNRVREALPYPHRERERRSRLYRSSVYLYLLARGFGADLDCANELAHIIASELEAMTAEPSPDITDLSLLLAARLELATIAPVGQDSLRRIAGRIAGADVNWEGALALQWLLEIYGSRWPGGEDGGGLREAARAYIERAGSPSPPAGVIPPVVAAMRLEMVTRHDPEFRLVSKSAEEAAIAARLRHRRWFEGGAYLFVVAVISGGPMYAAVSAGWFSPLIGWAGALSLAVPVATYALLVVTGRPRDWTPLGVGMTMGFLYWAAALYAGATDAAGWFHILGGEGVLLALGPAALTSLWAGVSAIRRR